MLREFVISLSMGCCVSYNVICIKCIFSRCFVSAAHLSHSIYGNDATCKHFSIFRICKCEHKIEFASFSIARERTAISVIEIFRVIKRNYLDSTDSLHWCEVIAWSELKTIKFNCFGCRQINLNTFADFTNSFSNIFSLFMHILW